MIHFSYTFFLSVFYTHGAYYRTAPADLQRAVCTAFTKQLWLLAPWARQLLLAESAQPLLWVSHSSLMDTFLSLLHLSAHWTPSSGALL